MSDSWIIEREDRVLVTGAGGFIGQRLTEFLLKYGFRNIRCLVRAGARADALRSAVERHAAWDRVAIVAGDLTSKADCQRIAEGVNVIYHLAAGTDKSFAGAFMNSALSTRNLIDAFVSVGQPRRFVSVSSFAVYSNMNMKRGALLDESAPLETAPQERHDAYAFGKLKQEEIVRQLAEEHRLPCVIMRPGTVFGPGRPSLTGRIGIDTFGLFLHLGGSNQLPLTYVDNCAEAILLAGLKLGIDGEIFNIVDDELMTSSQFLRAYRERVGGFFTLRLPYFAASLLCRLWEQYSIRSKGQLPPAFNPRRCAADWKGNVFSNRKLRDELGWRPRVPMAEALQRFLDQFPPRLG